MSVENSNFENKPKPGSENPKPKKTDWSFAEEIANKGKTREQIEAEREKSEKTAAMLAKPTEEEEKEMTKDVEEKIKFVERNTEKAIEELRERVAEDDKKRREKYKKR